MPLETMIVSRDWQEVSVLECILNSLHIGVAIHQDIAVARDRLAKTKIDALILDRDLSGMNRLLESFRADSPALPFILISRSAEDHDLPTSGATFFFEKPISVEQAVRTLSATRNLMMMSRMRYHRHELHVPVALRCGTRKRITAELTNLSHGGVGVRASQTLEPCGPVSVRFKIPGLDRAFTAKGELAWADQRGHAGIRFIEVSANVQQTVQQWLDQRYFAS